LVNSFATLAVSTVLAGFLAAPLITTRSLALQERLDQTHLGAGFAGLYAANGAGYGVAGLLVGGLLPFGARLAYVVPLAVAIAVGFGSSLFALRHRP
jgi:hypothetical protein